MKAVVTTGGRVDAAYASAAGTAIKALADVRGQTMLSRVVAALRGAGAERIAIVGGDEVRARYAAQVERFVPEAPTGSGNVLLALGAWSDDDGEPLLYATSDMPYVTAQAVAAFARAVPHGAIALPLVEHDAFARRFPGAPPYGITLAGEKVVNGGIFSIPAGTCARVAGVATKFFEARKQPWRMATLASPIAMLRFALGRLSIVQLEELAQRILGVPARAVRGSAPELGFDADTAAEFEYARDHE